MQLEIEGRLGGGHEIARHRHAGFPHKSHQAFAVFVKGNELVFKLLERAGDDADAEYAAVRPEKGL